MRALVIGTGAGGNKAAINLIEKGVIAKEDVVLVNSTLKDIPMEYRDGAVQLSLEQSGCGKERNVGKDISIQAIGNGRLNLDKFVLPQHEKAIVITSLEGGTGCGSSIIIAKYLKDVININVDIYGFAGFEDDGRGLQNTIEFFQDLEQDYIIHTIRNSAFLEAANGNKLKAEKMANDELAKRIRVELGQVIVDSEQNIDDTDLYKVTNTSGYTMIEYKEIDGKIKSVDQYSSILKDMLDETKSLEPDEKSVQRLAVIMNIPKASQDFIDFRFNEIKERLGVPYECFNHIQDSDNMPRFIAIIASGMMMPKDEVQGIYDRYIKQSQSVNKNADQFFNQIKELRGDAADDKFNMVRKSVEARNASKQDFLNSFKKDTTSTNVAKSSKVSKNNNTSVDSEY